MCCNYWESLIGYDPYRISSEVDMIYESYSPNDRYELSLIKVPPAGSLGKRTRLHELFKEIFGATPFQTRDLVQAAPCILARNLTRATAFKIKWYLEGIPDVEIALVKQDARLVGPPLIGESSR